MDNNQIEEKKSEVPIIDKAPEAVPAPTEMPVQKENQPETGEESQIPATPPAVPELDNKENTPAENVQPGDDHVEMKPFSLPNNESDKIQLVKEKMAKKDNTAQNLSEMTEFANALLHVQ